jgi:hypothetical protein
MPVTNIVEAVLGREQVKWDALWRLFTWLLDAQEGHALGSKVVDEFCRHALGTTFELRKLRREYQLSAVKDGKGKWADLALAIPTFEAPTHIVIMDDIDRRSPGGKRKLENLLSYRRLAREMFPLAIIRAVVLTNARDGSSMSKMYDGLGSEASDSAAVEGWKLLPLCVVGDWIEGALASSASAPPEKMKLFLLDFVEWSKSLDSRIGGAGGPAFELPKLPQ